MNWREVPFLRLLFPFITGILIAEKFLPGLGTDSWTPVLLIIFTLSLLWLWHFFRPSFGWRPVFGGALNLGLVFLGLFIVRQSDPRGAADFFAKDQEKEICLKASIEMASPVKYGWRLLSEVTLIKNNKEKWEGASGRLLVYLPEGPEPMPGSHLVLTGKLQPVDAPGNPEAFDYATYMARRGVYHCVFLKKGQYRMEKSGGPQSLFLVADRIRRHGLEILKKHLTDQEVFAVGSALTLGHREAVGEELRTIYARTGATHILAVSGLHVGLVYWVLAFFLDRITITGHWWRTLKTFLLLAGIWIFVLIAGMPPSALRAGTMFSFFIIGRLGKRSSNIYNLLAASAFCLLLFQPLLLFDVGFQLSYAAVASIITFQPLIYRTVYFSHPVPDYFWRLVSLSLSAQLGALPLSLYYFHQFPTYFLLSGLVAVPAAGMILGGGLSLILLDGVPVAGALTGTALEMIIQALNWSLDRINRLPFGHLDGIWMEVPTMALLYLIIGSLALGWREKNKMRWASAAMALVLLPALRAYDLWRLHNQCEMVVYHVSGHTVIDLIQERKCLTLTGGELPQEEEEYAARNFRWSRRLRQHSGIRLKDTVMSDNWCYRAGLIEFAGRRIFLAGPGISVEKLPEMKLDILLLRADPGLKVKDLCKKIRAELIIIDASNSGRYADEVSRDCKDLNVSFLNIRDRGGRVIDLRKLAVQDH